MTTGAICAPTRSAWAVMYELVIFDCHGVLVDSEVISNEVLARMLTREGLPTTLREARRDYQGLLLTDVRPRPKRSSAARCRPIGSPRMSASAHLDHRLRRCLRKHNPCIILQPSLLRTHRNQVSSAGPHIFAQPERCSNWGQTRFVDMFLKG